MRKLDSPVLDREKVHKMIYDILNDEQRKTYEETFELDFSMSLGDYGRFRVNVFKQNRGDAAAFRPIPQAIPTYEELGLPKVLQTIARADKGLVLVTGPTGSGKSTTLAAMINQINSEFQGHIITVEDPIEFVYRSNTSLVNQRELGPHTKSFANALRSALREDPDVILVGENDGILETIALVTERSLKPAHLRFRHPSYYSAARQDVDRIYRRFPGRPAEPGSRDVVGIPGSYHYPGPFQKEGWKGEGCCLRDYDCDARHKKHDPGEQDSSDAFHYADEQGFGHADHGRGCARPRCAGTGDDR